VKTIGYPDLVSVACLPSSAWPVHVSWNRTGKNFKVKDSYFDHVERIVANQHIGLLNRTRADYLLAESAVLAFDMCDSFLEDQLTLQSHAVHIMKRIA